MKFFKKHRKGLIVLGVLILVFVGGFLGLRELGNRTMSALATALVETAYPEKRDLVSVVASTGKIVSADNKSISASVTGTKVSSVNVKVGDVVKEGDLLVRLETTSLEESLEDANRNLENTKKSNDLSVSSASRRLNEAVTSGNVTDAKYAEERETAQKNLDDTIQLRDQAENLYNSAVDAKIKAQNQYTEAVETLNTIKSKIDKLTNSEGDVSKKKLTTLNNQLADTKVLINTYKAALDAAENAVNGQLANYQSYKSQVESYEKTLENIDQNREDAKRNSDANIASSRDSLNSTKLSVDGATTSIERQIESLNEQIAACEVTAPINGVVTAVNVEVGDTYSGMSMVTIEDVSAYEISTEIDEYDISKIKVGQRVVIKTNGTGDVELKGTVKSIAPRASAGSSVTYNVIVSVETKNDDLKLDMTAKLSIVLQESKNTLTLPYDAVFTDEDNNKYVEVVDSRDENGGVITHKVYVTTGIETDYYTEIITGDISETDEVKVERESSSVIDFSSFLTGDGAMSGM